MSRAYIYMEHPHSGEVLTLGRLTLQGKVAEFVYAPDHVERGGWVPDPINYPLRAEAYVGIAKNRGIPGFINDAMPDGWGERLLHRAFGQALAPIDYLLKSPIPPCALKIPLRYWSNVSIARRLPMARDVSQCSVH